MRLDAAARQASDSAIVEYIAAFEVSHRMPPTVREVGRRFGWSSSATAHFHLKRLERLGLLVRVGSNPRGMRYAAPVEVSA